MVVRIFCDNINSSVYIHSNSINVCKHNEGKFEEEKVGRIIRVV